MTPRVATLADAPAIAETLTAAFRHDPVWGWALPDPEPMAIWWRLFIDGALRYPWVWITPSCEAAALWIPPGGTELPAASEDRLGALLADLIGPRADQVLRALEHFEAALPHDEPFYYLSLLGTHPDHRGRGLSMALVAENLARIDTEHRPAYLESTNPANDARYRRVGFEPRSRFAVFEGGPVVTTMWRPAR